MTDEDYESDLHEARTHGFVTDATIMHFKGHVYKIEGHMRISDNGPYDGRLGIVYYTDYGTGLTDEKWCRPWSQFLELHGGEGHGIETRFEVMQLVPASIIALVLRIYDSNDRYGLRLAEQERFLSWARGMGVELPEEC